MHFVNIEECIEESDPDVLADDDDMESSMSMDFALSKSGARKKLADNSSSKSSTVEAAPGKSAAASTTAVPELFRIPELPRGQHLVVNILSTWGDPFYVGLMGIELFDHTGHSVFLSDVDTQLSADPPDLNVLDHGDRVDPRTVDKLVDGHYFTCDELHAWLSPFTRGQNHFVYFDLDYPLALSMIRVWNYNTTRIHSYRGARYVEISLDGKPIFKGEIRRAPGSVLEDVDACNECILFTTNASILHLIEKYDKQQQQQQGVAGGTRHLSVSDAEGGSDRVDTRALERPKTGNRAGRSAARGPGLHLNVATSVDMTATSVCAPVTPLPKGMKAVSTAMDASPPPLRPCTAPIAVDQMANERPLCCQKVTVVLEANWGDPYEIGLAGIEFLDGSYAPLRMDAAVVSASGGAHSTSAACSQFERLVRSHGARHQSIDPREMWCVRLQDGLGSSRALSIDFGTRTALRALKVWNYNTTLEDSFKGAKQLTVFVDGVLHARFSLRKAPGNLTDFDFGQFLYFRSQSQQQLARMTKAPGMTPTTKDFQSDGEISKQSEKLAPIPTGTHALVMDKEDGQQSEKGYYRHLDAASDTGMSMGRTASRGLLTTTAMRPISELFQQYQTPLFPTGYIVKFVFLSTWGDKHYLGLNGVELFDRHNCLIELNAQMIDAQPRDINILKEPGAPHDVRTLDKLYDGMNNTYDDRHMWLAPFTPSQSNKLVLFFNEPVTLSKISMWNYSKTPARGVKEFEIFMDDVLIFHGVLKQAPPFEVAGDGGGDAMDLASPLDNRRLRRKRFELAEAAAAAANMTQTMLFTDDMDVLEAEAANIYLPEEALEESVTFYDNSQVLSLSDTAPAEPVTRPTTSAGAAATFLSSVGGRGRSCASGSPTAEAVASRRTLR